jgi:hypothetical protein
MRPALLLSGSPAVALNPAAAGALARQQGIPEFNLASRLDAVAARNG